MENSVGIEEEVRSSSEVGAPLPPKIIVFYKVPLGFCTLLKNYVTL
jgi:hypothetical protein